MYIHTHTHTYIILLYEESVLLWGKKFKNKGIFILKNCSLAGGGGSG